MKHYNLFALLLIASGAIVMLFSIFKYNQTIRLANGLLSAKETRIRLLEKFHRVLMCGFLVGYLVVIVILVADLAVVGNMVIGLIFLFGAIFVLLGIVLQTNMLLSIRQHYDEIVSKNSQLIQTENVTIFALALQAEIRDRETGKHLERCCQYVKLLADELSLLPKYRLYLTQSYITDIVRASSLHDIGKVGVPDAILQKSSKLSTEEFENIKKHCEYGASILREAEKKLDFKSFFSIAIKIILSHHERWDGSGYPYGLTGDTIPLSARIMALADVYDALTTKRCYKAAIPHQETVNIINSEKGKHFDPDVCEAFLRKEKEFLQISALLADSIDDA